MNETVQLWSLREDVVVEPETADGECVLTGPWGWDRIEGAPAVVREALRRMELGPVLLKNLEPCPDGPASQSEVLPLLLRTFEQLSHLVIRTLGPVGLGGPLLSVCPVSREAQFAPVRVSRCRPVRLPRGVTCTLESQGFALERPGGAFRVVLHRPEAMWVVGTLVRPTAPEELARMLPLPVALVENIVGYLASAGMLLTDGPDPRSPGPDPGSTDPGSTDPDPSGPGPEPRNG
ncbi:NADH oxidase [Streptomyces sp. NPDC091272]|uniref:NADH oxidase n=1 Tax=Streptomyces sp. NPDC091272 TaxID=3365981 RepID=UPI003809BF8B